MAKKNPYLKTANTEETYTHEELIELKRCYKDPIYFIKNYVWIIHPTDGSVLFNLFDYQEDMIDSFHKEQYSIVLSARQTGKCVSEDSKVNVVNASKIPWYKKAILWLFDNNTYERIYSKV